MIKYSAIHYFNTSRGIIGIVKLSAIFATIAGGALSQSLATH
jgi:hypothetical protein